MRTACIIQGDIRKNTNIIRDKMLKLFDVVIISTWEGEEDNIDKVDNCFLLFNKKPVVAGFSHRNFQRFSTAQGLRKARELNCDYVLKWRTDMLPLSLDVADLINKSNFKTPIGFKSRIVTCSFRCLTVKEDFLSSIPDLFAFGHISVMELLWNDNDFNYLSHFNLPEKFKAKEYLFKETDLAGFYCSETELYAILRARLETVFSKNFNHEYILKNFFYLFNHRDLEIIWFSEKGYRPILQLHFPWWTPDIWKGKKRVKSIAAGYPSSLFQRFIVEIRIILLTRYYSYIQKLAFRKFSKKGIKDV